MALLDIKVDGVTILRREVPTELVAALEKWRLSPSRRKVDGTPYYPTVASVLNNVLADFLKSVLAEFPSPVIVQAQTVIQAEKDRLETILDTDVPEEGEGNVRG